MMATTGRYDHEYTLVDASSCTGMPTPFTSRARNLHTYQYSKSANFSQFPSPLLFRNAYTHSHVTELKDNANNIPQSFSANPYFMHSRTGLVTQTDIDMNFRRLNGRPMPYAHNMDYPKTDGPNEDVDNLMDEFRVEFKTTVNPNDETDQTYKKSKKKRRAEERSDENNNFMRQHRGDFAFNKHKSGYRVNTSWRQQKEHMRILSQPKRGAVLCCEHRHPTGSVSLYDVNGERSLGRVFIPRTCDGRIVPIHNPRIEKLARPKTYSNADNKSLVRSQYQQPTCTVSLHNIADRTQRHNVMRTCDGRIVPPCNPRIDRLARPKRYCDVWGGPIHDVQERTCPPICFDRSSGEIIVNHASQLDSMQTLCQQPKINPFSVKKAALNAIATRRLEKLAVPRKIIDSGEFHLWLRNKQPNVDAILKPVKKLSIDKVDLSGERIFLRCDLDYQGYLTQPRNYTVWKVGEDYPTNVRRPLNIEEKVAKVLPTILFCLNKGAKAVIIASHCGDPLGRRDPSMSLKSVAENMSKLLNKEITFCEDATGVETRALCEDPEPGSIFFLENLRFYPEENGFGVDEDGNQFLCTKKQVKDFREKLFTLGDVFVLDSYTNLVGMSNSTFGDSKQERAYGLNVKNMLETYNKYITRPVKPMVAVIGGEFNDVFEIVYNIMGKADEILLGGEIANIFLKTLKGIDIGVTKSSSVKEKKVLKAMSRAKDICCTVNLPSDLVVRDTTNIYDYFTVCTKLDVLPSFEIMDIGTVTRKCYGNTILGASSVVWLGNMGQLLDGTTYIAQSLSDATLNGTKTFIMDELTLDIFSSTANHGDLASVHRSDSNQAGVVEVDISQGGFISDVAHDGDVTRMLLRNKIPKSLAALSPYRKHMKKHPMKIEDVSTKPLSRDVPVYGMEKGCTRLCVDDIDVAGKRVLIVTDMAGSITDGEVTDNFAIRMALPTIKWVLKRGAELVFIVSQVETGTLQPIALELEKLLYRNVIFIDHYHNSKVQRTIDMAHPGSVIMFENVLLKPEEHYTFEMEKIGNETPCLPENVAGFCGMLSSICDIYVNDAFGLLHKDMSSVTGTTHILRPCGFLVKNQLKYISQIFNNPKRKLLAIIGGHESDTETCAARQMDTARALARDVDEMILTGSLGLHCLWVEQGMHLGLSYDRSILKQDLENLMEFLRKNKVRLYFPVDLILTDDAELGGGLVRVSTSEGVAQGKVFADVGPKTNYLFRRIVKRSRLALWLGLVGIGTFPESFAGTRALYDTLVECTQSQDIGLVSIASGPRVISFCHQIDPSNESLSHTINCWQVLVALLTEKRIPALDVISFNAKARKEGLIRMSMVHTDLSKKRVLLRCDFVHIFKPDVARKYLEEVASTIRSIFSKGAVSIVLFGHIGEPQGRKDDTLSTRSCRQELEKVLVRPIKFFENGLSDSLLSAVQSSNPGTLIMLENIRFNPEEEGYGIGYMDKKIITSYEAMDYFRHRLSKLGDIFINDSLESLNTTDCSVVGLHNEHRVAGPLVHKEFVNFSTLIPKFNKPILCVVGGRSVFDKVLHIYHLIEIANDIIICGSVSFTFLKVIFGMQIGKSEFDKQAAKLVPRVMKKAKMNNVGIHFPKDWLDKPADEPILSINKPSIRSNSPNPEEKPSVKKEPWNDEPLETIYTKKTGIPENTKAMDIGPASVNLFSDLINKASVILYTGRAGLLEEGTASLVEAIAERTEEEGVISIAYDCRIVTTKTVSYDGFSHVSNASLKLFADIILGKPLPGLDYLNPTAMKPCPVPTVFDIPLEGKKVILKLDLDVPTVEGVVLNTDKIESALPTITYLLAQKPRCLILCGSRGNPNGYRNYYLSMEPLVKEFENSLGIPVSFIDSPCSRSARIMCEMPNEGSVFLLENLKFYPAELGSDDEVVDVLDEDTDMGYDSLRKTTSVSTTMSGISSHLNVGNGSVSTKVFNIDRLMWEVMPAKTVEQYNREIGDLADVFVNDDVKHMWEELTSNFGFDLSIRACGPQMKDELNRIEMDEHNMRTCPAVIGLLSEHQDLHSDSIQAIRRPSNSIYPSSRGE